MTESEVRQLMREIEDAGPDQLSGDGSFSTVDVAKLCGHRAMRIADVGASV